MKQYYILKKEITAKNINNGFDEILLTKRSVVQFKERYVRYKSSTRSVYSTRNIYSTYRFKMLVEEYKLDKKVFKLKTYEFTINDKFLFDFLDTSYNNTNNLLIDLNSKLHKIFQEKVSANKISS